MFSETSYTYEIFFITAFTIIIGLVYVYSLFNLYIGRKAQKYKITLLVLNFLFLTGYIVLLINIPEYNHVPLILLLIVILAIIVLGLIGAFMFNVDYSIDKSNEFKKHIKIFKRILKVPLVLVILGFGGILTYEILTHDVQRLRNIRYILDIKETDIYCDADLGFGLYDDADLFLFCDDNFLNTSSITEISIFFDNVLIHENSYTTYSIEEGIVYTFNYNFEEIQKYSDVNEITLILTVEEEHYTYAFDIYGYDFAYDYVTVPIWVNE